MTWEYSNLNDCDQIMSDYLKKSLIKGIPTVSDMGNLLG